MKVMIAAEHLLKLLGIIAATGFTFVFLTLWVQSTHAQNSLRETQAETNRGVRDQISEQDRRMDTMDRRLNEQDRTIADLRSSISTFQGVGVGFGAIMIFIAVVSYLVQQKSK